MRSAASRAFRAVRGWQRQAIRSAKGAKCAATGTKRVPGESGALHGSRMIWKASMNRNPTYSSGRPLRKMKMVQKWRRIERQGGLQSVGGGFESLQGGAGSGRRRTVRNRSRREKIGYRLRGNRLKGGESNRNAGEERTAVRVWRGAMKGSKSVLELAKQSWHSDRFL